MRPLAKLHFLSHPISISTTTTTPSSTTPKYVYAAWSRFFTIFSYSSYEPFPLVPLLWLVRCWRQSSLPATQGTAQLARLNTTLQLLCSTSRRVSRVLIASSSFSQTFAGWHCRDAILGVDHRWHPPRQLFGHNINTTPASRVTIDRK